MKKTKTKNEQQFNPVKIHSILFIHNFRENFSPSMLTMTSLTKFYEKLTRMRNACRKFNLKLLPFSPKLSN